MKKILILSFCLILTACTPNEAAFKSRVPVSQPSVPVTADALPESVNLSVPFYPQAPDADWSLPWQEACEEASVVLAYYGATGQSITRDEFREELLKIIDWEMKNLGHYEHTNAVETARILKDYYGYTNFEILENPSIDDLKDRLAQGRLIIAPFAGRELGNPFYSGIGPLYHMMVIRGYDDEHFITNDVGTKRGANFVYPYKRLLNAMHEWHDEDIDLGAKNVIVLQGT
ncbi:MAG: C39 family peptidase [Candidatus Peregrinibacteria bacterium]